MKSSKPVKQVRAWDWLSENYYEDRRFHSSCANTVYWMSFTLKLQRINKWSFCDCLLQFNRSYGGFESSNVMIKIWRVKRKRIRRNLARPWAKVGVVDNLQLASRKSEKGMNLHATKSMQSCKFLCTNAFRALASGGCLNKETSGVIWHAKS